jgi:hypothetical protein
MVEDIRRSIHDARANYLVALGLFSYLEVIGGLITGHGALPNSKKSTSNFNEAIKHLPQDYGDLDSKLRVTDAKGNTRSGLYNAFRCGLVHEYSPKGLVIVWNDPGREPAVDRCGIKLETVDEHGTKRLAINNNELFRDFQQLVEKVGQWVDDSDPTYYPRVRAVFERMAAYKVDS